MIRRLQAKKDLKKYLENMRDPDLVKSTVEQQTLIDFALLKIYLAEKNWNGLKNVTKKNNLNPFADQVVPILEKNHPKYLAYFYWSNNEREKALTILKEY